MALFLTDEVNSGESDKPRRRKSAVPGDAAALGGGFLQGAAHSTSRRPSAVPATNLVPDSKRRPSFNPSASPPPFGGSPQLAATTSSSHLARTVSERDSLAAAVDPMPPTLLFIVPPEPPFRAFDEEAQPHNVLLDVDDGERLARSRRSGSLPSTERSPQPKALMTPSGRSIGATPSDKPVDPEGFENGEGFDDQEEIPSSLFIFSGTNDFRLMCLRLIQNWYFHQFILVCILANSVFLALDQPAIQNPDWLAGILTVSEYFFTLVFLIEMIVKIVALGLVLHEQSYLRVPWNCLDGIIVTSSVINLFVSGGNFSALRVIRVLRPLRSVARVKKLKLLIAGLFAALPEVANTLLLFLFCLTLFAIALTQLWPAKLSQRCYIAGFEDNASRALIAMANNSFGPLYFPMLQQDDSQVCGTGRSCDVSGSGWPIRASCEIRRDQYTKPNLNYDNFAAALALVLKVTVFDNWHDDMDDAFNFAGVPVALLVFIPLTLIGGYVCVNLFLAVLTDGYSDAAKAMKLQESDELHDAGTQTDFKHIDRHDNDRVHEALASFSRLRRSKSSVSSPRLTRANTILSDRTSRGSSSSASQQLVHVTSPTSGGAADELDFGTKVDVVIAELEHIPADLDDADSQFDGESGANDASFRLDDHEDDRCLVRKRVGHFMTHHVVEIIVMLVTLLNVTVLAIDHYGIDPSTSDTLDIISLACTAVFAIEISVKLFAFGPQCLLNGFNALDFVLVVIGIVTAIISGGGGSAFAAFRALRVFRVFRFLKRFESLQTVIDSILQSIVSIGYLSMLILLFLYIYAILGMQLFGTAYGRSDASVRDSFGTIWDSAITAFIVVTGDNWTDKMQVAMRDFGGASVILPALYFISLNLIGNFILINLSVAIIVDKLQEKMDAHDARANAEIHPPVLLLPPYNISIMARKQQMEEEYSRLAASPEGVAMPLSRASFRRSMRMPKIQAVLAPATKEDAATANAQLDQYIAGTDGNRSSSGEAKSPVSAETSSPHANAEHTQEEEEAPAALGRYSDHIEDDQDSCSFRLTLLQKYVRTFFISVPPVVSEPAFFVLTPENPLRKACLWLIGLPCFHVFILLAITANVVFLFLDGPHAARSTQDAIADSDNFFATLFLLEAAVKIIALGAFLPGPIDGEKMRGMRISDRPTEAYFRDPWNCVDFFVTLVAFISLFVPFFRPLRSLRTIRLVARIESTRIILVALVQAIPHVLHGLFLSGIVFLVFGILGVQLYKGLFYSCSDPAITDRDLCVGNFTYQTPAALGNVNATSTRQWQRQFYHFDDLGSALLTLFVVSVGDNWSLVMYNGMDVTDDRHGLQLRASPWMALYFIAMYIAGNFFSINMMIGILINYFKRKKREQDGSAFLTAKQQLYLRAREAMDEALQMEDEVKVLPLRISALTHSMITYKHPKFQRASVFDLALLMVILLNTACVAAEHDGMDPGALAALNGVELACLCVFTVEMMLKWVAYGWFYFAGAWNRFDCIIVLVGWIAEGLPQVSFLAFLRVFRVIKLIRGTGVERLVLKLLRSIRTLLNVVSILVLTYFIFAVAGVSLFGTIRLTGSLDRLNNFQTVWNAMLVLYYSGTTDSWEIVLQDLSVGPPQCDPAISGDCGTAAVATIFMVCFMIACTFIALQLFVAVIVEIFSDDETIEDPVRAGFLELRGIWISCFGDSAHSVHYIDLVQCIPMFPSALTGFEPGEEITRADMIRFLSGVSLPIDSRHHVKYKDFVNSLAFRLYQVDPRTMTRVVGDIMDSLLIGSSFSAAQVYALDVIADLWQQYQGNKKLFRKGATPAASSSRSSSILGESDCRVVHFSDAIDVSPPSSSKPDAVAAARPSTAASPMLIVVEECHDE